MSRGTHDLNLFEHCSAHMQLVLNTKRNSKTMEIGLLLFSIWHLSPNLSYFSYPDLKPRKEFITYYVTVID